MLQALKTYLEGLGGVQGAVSSRVFQPQISIGQRKNKEIKLEYSDTANVILITEPDAEEHDTPIAIAFVHADSSVFVLYLSDMAEVE